MKKIMYILTILLSLSFIGNINAEEYRCNYSDAVTGVSSTCTKLSYKYDKNGNEKDFEIVLGVYHIKRTDAGNPNEEIIQSFDSCDSSYNEKYCEKKFKTNYPNGSVSIGVSSDKEVYPIAICAQPGEIITDSNISKYVYFTEEDISNNKGNCQEGYVFYNEKSSQDINSVCEKVSDVTLDLGYISNYKITPKVTAGVCRITINYQSTINGPVNSQSLMGIAPVEICHSPSRYKLTFKESIGDPIHPTGYKWELKYCKPQEINSGTGGDNDTNNNKNDSDKNDSDKNDSNEIYGIGFLDIGNKEVVCNGYGIPYGLPYIIHKIINLIKILTPIVLIILGMIDYSKAVIAGNEDEMKKSSARFIKRVIAGVIVFLVIAIVQFAFNLLGNNDTFSCFSCFVSGKDCNIKIVDE